MGLLEYAPNVILNVDFLNIPHHTYILFDLIQPTPIHLVHQLRTLLYFHELHNNAIALLTLNHQYFEFTYPLQELFNELTELHWLLTIRNRCA